MSDLLAELDADVNAWDARRPRSQQRAIGGSALLGCPARTAHQLHGLPASDDVSKWRAVIGTLVHGMLEEARAHRGVVSETRFESFGVAFTVDEIDGTTLRDFKTKKLDGIAYVRKHGPDRQQRAQVHGGAYAAQVAGHEITHVQLVYLPVDGPITAGYVHTEPYSQELADEGLRWAQWVQETPQSHLPCTKERWWCRSWCEHASNQHGPPYVDPVPSEDSPVDPEVEEAARRYDEARRAKAEAEAVMRSAAERLPAHLPARYGQWTLGRKQATGGALEVDVEAVLADYAARGVAVPMRPGNGRRGALVVERAT